MTRKVVGPYCQFCKVDMKRVEATSDITGYKHGQWAHVGPDCGRRFGVKWHEETPKE